MQIYNHDAVEFERTNKDASTKEYMEAWNYAHNMKFEMARGYVQKIRQGQHDASLLAIKQFLS